MWRTCALGWMRLGISSEFRGDAVDGGIKSLHFPKYRLGAVRQLDGIAARPGAEHPGQIQRGALREAKRH